MRLWALSSMLITQFFKICCINANCIAPFSHIANRQAKKIGIAFPDMHSMCLIFMTSIQFMVLLILYIIAVAIRKNKYNEKMWPTTRSSLFLAAHHLVLSCEKFIRQIKMLLFYELLIIVHNTQVAGSSRARMPHIRMGRKYTACNTSHNLIEYLILGALCKAPFPCPPAADDTLDDEFNAYAQPLNAFIFTFAWRIVGYSEGKK